MENNNHTESLQMFHIEPIDEFLWYDGNMEKRESERATEYAYKNTSKICELNKYRKQRKESK